MTNHARWAVRKIRKGGLVKIGKKWYQAKPCGIGAIPYDGRLDGMLYLFGRYPKLGKDEYEPFVYLACPAEHMGKGPDECPPDPQVIDGVYNWVFWDEVKA